MSEDEKTKKRDAGLQESRSQAKVPSLTTEKEKDAAARAVAAFDAEQIGKYAAGQGMTELTKGESEARNRMLKNEKKREDAWNNALAMLQKSKASGGNPLDSMDAAFYAMGTAFSNLCNLMYSGTVNGVFRGGFKAKAAEKALKQRTDMKAAQARVDVGERPFGIKILPKGVEMKLFYMKRDMLNEKLARHGKAQIMSMSPMEPATMLMGAGLHAADRLLAGDDPANVYDEFRRVKLNIGTAAKEFGHDPIEIQNTYVDMMCDALRCDREGAFRSDGSYVRVGKTVEDGRVGYRVVGYDAFKQVMHTLCNDRESSMLDIDQVRALSGSDAEVLGLSDLAAAMKGYAAGRSGYRPARQGPSPSAETAAVDVAAAAATADPVDVLVAGAGPVGAGGHAEDAAHPADDAAHAGADAPEEVADEDIASKVAKFIERMGDGDYDGADPEVVAEHAHARFMSDMATIKGETLGFEQSDVDTLALLRDEAASGFAHGMAADESVYGRFYGVHAAAVDVLEALPADARPVFEREFRGDVEGIVDELRTVNTQSRLGLDMSRLDDTPGDGPRSYDEILGNDAEDEREPVPTGKGPDLTK